MNTIYLIKLIGEIKDIMAENKDYLIQLDSVVGDGDLGLTMSDGYLAAYNAISDGTETDVGKLLYTAGKAMSVAVPSTMGTLMASGFMQAGKVLKGKTELTDYDIVELFSAYMDGVMNRGKAKVGDKTFLDGLNPALIALRERIDKGESLQAAANASAKAAEEGFENTATMIAVHGRAATRGEMSRNLKDPGAAVAMLIMKAFAKSLAD
ncbi:MAG: dihydroxyacetone kinase subunit L [Clostridiales bacterium]|nr:dihydroxyacetone kinase subunit L [Clostridiales bacterium]